MSIDKIWDSNAEKIALKLLKDIIDIENYDINVHTSLKEIFPSPSKESWADFHIDFIITDKEGYPVLGIELSGIEHWNDSQSLEHDKIKKQIFFDHSVPLIVIPIGEIENLSKDAYKNIYENELCYMIRMHLSPLLYNTNYPAYCWTCGKQLTYRYRKDHAASFYCCTNKGCLRCQRKDTISQKAVSILSKPVKLLMTEWKG